MVLFLSFFFIFICGRGVDFTISMHTHLESTFFNRTSTISTYSQPFFMSWTHQHVLLHEYKQASPLFVINRVVTRNKLRVLFLVVNSVLPDKTRVLLPRVRLLSRPSFDAKHASLYILPYIIAYCCCRGGAVTAVNASTPGVWARPGPVGGSHTRFARHFSSGKAYYRHQIESTLTRTFIGMQADRF